jgi:hypothetical protein
MYEKIGATTKEGSFGDKKFWQKVVKQNRIPIFVDAFPGKGIRTVYCFVPPEGVQKEDSANGTQNGGFEFLSPDGKSKGFAAMHIMSPAQASEAKQTIERIRKNLKI